jgi:hypothetical protein
MAKSISQREPTVKTQPRAAGENVSVNIQRSMTVHEMQLILSRVYAIAALDPQLAEFAASLEGSLRKLIEARVTREGFRSPAPMH